MFRKLVLHKFVESSIAKRKFDVVLLTIVPVVAGFSLEYDMLVPSVNNVNLILFEAFTMSCIYNLKEISLSEVPQTIPFSSDLILPERNKL